MLEIRPSSENWDKVLPNNSTEAMICKFECTFCTDCVINVLHNVCPNCGGGFEKRPSRPTNCLTTFRVTNYPAKSEKKLREVDQLKFKAVLETFRNIEPHKR